jgi:hypothetical protein
MQCECGSSQVKDNQVVFNKEVISESQSCAVCGRLKSAWGSDEAKEVHIQRDLKKAAANFLTLEYESEDVNSISLTLVEPADVMQSKDHYLLSFRSYDNATNLCNEHTAIIHSSIAYKNILAGLSLAIPDLRVTVRTGELRRTDFIGGYVATRKINESLSCIVNLYNYKVMFNDNYTRQGFNGIHLLFHESLLNEFIALIQSITVGKEKLDWRPLKGIANYNLFLPHQWKSMQEQLEQLSWCYAYYSELNLNHAMSKDAWFLNILSDFYHQDRFIRVQDKYKKVTQYPEPVPPESVLAHSIKMRDV